ncbi:MAG: hypothetical protein CM15mP120_22510 [Pseudomonadota bacterium]|nr:MAG: hypothetical protein CM15mP120_22510 [Pseudomonadota bacterium]
MRSSISGEIRGYALINPISPNPCLCQGHGLWVKARYPAIYGGQPVRRYAKY